MPYPQCVGCISDAEVQTVTPSQVSDWRRTPSNQHFPSHYSARLAAPDLDRRQETSHLHPSLYHHPHTVTPCLPPSILLTYHWLDVSSFTREISAGDTQDAQQGTE